MIIQIFTVSPYGLEGWIVKATLRSVYVACSPEIHPPCILSGWGYCCNPLFYLTEQDWAVKLTHTILIHQTMVLHKAQTYIVIWTKHGVTCLVKIEGESYTEQQVIIWQMENCSGASVASDIQNGHDICSRVGSSSQMPWAYVKHLDTELCERTCLVSSCWVLGPQLMSHGTSADLQSIVYM